MKKEETEEKEKEFREKETMLLLWGLVIFGCFVYIAMMFLGLVELNPILLLLFVFCIIVCFHGIYQWTKYTKTEIEAKRKKNIWWNLGLMILLLVILAIWLGYWAFVGF